MRNKYKIIGLGFVVSCMVITYVLCIPSVGAVGEEKYLEHIRALEIRITVLENQVAQLKKLVDQIITKPQPPTSIDTKSTMLHKPTQIESEADRQMKTAERNYQTAKRNRERLEAAGATRIFDPAAKMWRTNPAYETATKIEEKAHKEMIEAQKRYKETLQPRISK